MNYKPTPTVLPSINFDVDEHATALRDAMRGFATDKQIIINTLTILSNEERLELIPHYYNKFGRKLIEDLKSKLVGKFEDVIVALMLPTLEYACKQLHKSLKSINVSDMTIAEILFTKSNEEITAIAACYERMYSETLSEKILKKATSDYRSFLTLLMTEQRDPEGSVDEAKAQKQAEELYAVGKGNLSSREEIFYYMLAQCSFAQLRLIFAKYKNVAGHTIQEAVERGGMMGLTYIMQGIGEFLTEVIWKI